MEGIQTVTVAGFTKILTASAHSTPTLALGPAFLAFLPLLDTQPDGHPGAARARGRTTLIGNQGEYGAPISLFCTCDPHPTAKGRYRPPVISGKSTAVLCCPRLAPVNYGHPVHEPLASSSSYLPLVVASSRYTLRGAQYLMRGR